MCIVRFFRPVLISLAVLWLTTGPALAGPWSNTKHLASWNRAILSISSSGQVERTSAESGESVTLQSAPQGDVLQWANTQLLLADTQSQTNRPFYAIDQTGSLFAIAPKDGSAKRIGVAGSFPGVRLGAASSGWMYVVTTSGALLKINLTSGESSELGKPEWGGTRLIMAGETLYVIDKQGTLYRVNTETGAWIGVGQPGAWSATPAATVVGHRIFSVDVSGVMWETDGQSGSYKKIKSPVFPKTEKLFTDGSTVYIIYGDGQMERMRL